MTFPSDINEFLQFQTNFRQLFMFKEFPMDQYTIESNEQRLVKPKPLTAVTLHIIALDRTLGNLFRNRLTQPDLVYLVGHKYQFEMMRCPSFPAFENRFKGCQSGYHPFR